MAVANIDFNGTIFIISCRTFDNNRAKDIPDAYWYAEDGAWIAGPTLDAAKYIQARYTTQELTANAAAKIDELLAETSSTVNFPQNFQFKNQPRPYQMEALNRAYGMEEFALFMEMRTGKSFVDINLAACYYLEERIDAYLIVMFPGAIKSTWKIQIAEHMPVDYEMLVMQAGKNKKTQDFIDHESDKLKIMVVGIESLSQGSGPTLIEDFVAKHKVKFTIDESTCIKNPKALTNRRTKKRTRVKLCWDAGGLSEYRMIMTGTQITQGIEDLYSQFRFLNWNILGYKSYFAFKAAHCIMGGFENKKIMGYANVDRVIDSCMPYVYQISTEDAIGIPEEVIETVLVEQSVEQKRMLKELGDPYNMTTSLNADTLEIETILERMIRYQQIVGGHFPFNSGDKGVVQLKDNPKLDALMGVIATVPKDKKVIIWARFVPEILMIADALDKIDETYLTYRGGMEDSEREHAQLEFMKDDGPRFWVASQQASARGVELASASIHIFYSNSFSYDDRKQASMRTSSSHQKEKSILYVDIIMDHKIDKQIIDSLKRKQDMAEYVIEEMKTKQEERNG